MNEATRPTTRDKTAAASCVLLGGVLLWASVCGWVLLSARELVPLSPELALFLMSFSGTSLLSLALVSLAVGILALYAGIRRLSPEPMMNEGAELIRRRVTMGVLTIVLSTGLLVGGVCMGLIAILSETPGFFLVALLCLAFAIRLVYSGVKELSTLS